MTEIWGHAVNNDASSIAAQASAIEDAGFDGCLMSDSQTLRMECWVALTVAVLATQRIGIGSFATNPVTRHVSVIAGAAATLQQVSGRRFLLGVACGDSALAILGHGPATVGLFERVLINLQTLLRGDGTALAPEPRDGVPSIAAVNYASVLPECRIAWLSTALPDVRVNVIISGARTLKIGAVHGDEVAVVVGADADLLAEVASMAPGAKAAAGLDPVDLSINAMTPVHLDPDHAAGRRVGARSVERIGRFMAMQRGALPVLDETTRAAFEEIVANDNTRLTRTDREQLPQGPVPDELIDRFTLIGDPERSVARLGDIMAVGLARITVAPGPLFDNEVLPALRTGTAVGGVEL